MSEEAKLPQLLEHMILNLRMIYARSTLVEKALAHILASDAGLKNDIIKQLQVVTAANERDQIDLEQARIHLIDVLNSVPVKK
ncbi:hypothetical protein BMF90_21320 [Serratia sp. OLHL2]|jgi:hypothetical protein|uniref:Uncharacterized protein n=2 Tax=Serratia TaxID=613 RepID=A0A9X9G456_9GAMM|nr:MULTISPECIES: hypothetical protein [Serratia]WIF08226.1 hypothetical protein QEP77_08555 [Serratia sp. B1]AIM22249.1 hypothetical protein SERRSCBI_13245 [Serratia sp. SCBI]ALD46517.1 hypothetical protein AN479_19795 [Serratia marcescens]ASL93176.1 hypothetical protein BVG94_11160 [Serratia marcescens]ASM02722.1 hypothetical protein BVG88_11345 [Serratia marcescens]